MQTFKMYNGRTIKAQPLSGAFSLISNGSVILRQYNEDVEDFDVVYSLGLSGDLRVIVPDDESIWLYEKEDGSRYVDWAPKMIGLKEIIVET